MARRFRVILLLGFVVLAGYAGPPDTDDGSSAPPSASPPSTPSPSMSEDQGTPGPSSRPPLSSTPPPTPGTPSVRPTKPSDQVDAFWASGTVTRGGSGPCYGLVTDEGIEFALYSEAEAELVEGETVRARLRPASFRLDCGPGRLVSLLVVERG